MKISRKQQALLNLKSSSKNYVIINGAFRSGKTLFGCWGFCELIIDQQRNNPKYEGNRYFVIGHASVSKTYINVVERMITYLSHRGFTCTKKSAAFDYYCTDGTISFMIETFSASNRESYKKLQAGTYRSGLIDEAPLIAMFTLENIASRCITFPDFKIVHTGNPEGNETHPYYKKFLKDKQEDYAVIKFNLYDNPINTEVMFERMKRVFSKALFQQKVLGNWVSVDGAIYTKVPALFEDVLNLDFINFGIDYGETDATSCVALGIQGNKYIILDQFYHKNDATEHLTVNDYRDKLAEFINSVFKKYLVTSYVYCETSPITLYTLLSQGNEVDRRVEIKKVNKHKKFDKSSSGIVERINTTNLLLNDNKLFTLDKDLPVVEAIGNALWKTEGIRLDDGTTDIDSIDAFEYALISEIKKIHQEVLKYD